MNEEQYESLGLSLVNFLALKPNKETGRYDTEWGNKTLTGLGRCMERLMKSITPTEETST
jgi:hypothetical protein